MARAELPEVIVIDITEHKRDGYAICRQLKADPLTQDIPVIFINVLDTVADKLEAFAIGGVDYISRPFQWEEVHARVRTHLAIQRSQAELQLANERLERSLVEIERYAREQTRLNQLSSALYCCDSLGEAYAACIPFLHDLFAGQQGTLYRSVPGTWQVERVDQWGAGAAMPLTLGPLDCPALAGTLLGPVIDPAMIDGCGVCGPHAINAVICRKLHIRGQLSGLLHLRGSADESAAERDHWARLGLTTADLLALAFTNLRLREHLREQAVRDPLTGLFNRRFLEEVLAQHLSQAARHHRPLAICLLDLDHFKLVNDSYGHDAGDMVLRAVGDHLRARLRASDTACRFGGEEILLVLPEIAPEHALLRADSLRQDIHAMSLKYGEQLLPPVSVSIGVATFPEHGPTPAALIAAADEALYRAKAGGRNAVCLAEIARER